jgi:hypothetical protein
MEEIVDAVGSERDSAESQGRERRLSPLAMDYPLVFYD